MKMILLAIAALYFFAPEAVSGLGIKALVIVLLIRTVMDGPMMISDMFARRRHM